jgi:alcohol dehydrogenase
MPVLPDWVSYHFPPKIHLEVDCANKVGQYVKHIGNRVLLLTTQKDLSSGVDLLSIKRSIEQHTDGVIIYDDIESVASFKELDTASHFSRQAQINCIIAFGSYESVNAAKAVSLLTTNDLFAEELILGQRQVKKKATPLVVIPTMPLMGMECAPFCFISDERTDIRKYFAHINLFPELIISDPRLGSHMSNSDVAKTGTATLAAAVDCILSKFANEVTNASALRAIELVSKNIIPSIRDPKNMSARNALYAASLLAGISQSVSSLGTCFALSLSATSLTKLDVFQAMSIFLPHVMEYNLTSSANRYVMIARALDEDINDISIIEAAIRAVEGVRKVYIELKIPQKLSEYEVKKIELPNIAQTAAQFSFLDSLTKDLPKNEIETILVAAF